MAPKAAEPVRRPGAGRGPSGGETDATGNGAPRHWRSVGVLSGVVAVAAMTFVQALMRVWLEVPTPLELIGDRVGERVPVKPFLSLIGFVGSYGRLKASSVFGVLAATLVVGAVLGALYARTAERQRAAGATLGPFGVSRRAVVTLAATVGAAWVLSVAAFWPLLASYYRGAPRGTARAANAVALLFAYAVFAVVVVAIHRLLVRPATEPAEGSPVGRRALLVGGAGLGLAVATGGVMQRLYARSTFGYDGQQVNGDIEAITPIDKFYVVTQNLVDPRVDRGAWRLEVGGEVDQPHSYDFAAISRLPAVVQESTLACISNGVGGGLMSNARWKGVPLHLLLEQSRPRQGVRDVVFHGVDGYTDTFPLAKAMDPTTLVAYEMNGRPLPRRHGFPVRIIVPGLYGEKNVKWINRINLSATDEQGFYEHQGWGPDFAVRTQSRFTAPAFDRPLPLSPVTVKGTAFAGDRGVAKVEVSADDGASWQPATIDYSGSRLTWSLWSFRWTPSRSGDHVLMVRATDGAGGAQIDKQAPSGPEGATGLHRVTAKIA